MHYFFCILLCCCIKCYLGIFLFPQLLLKFRNNLFLRNTSAFFTQLGIFKLRGLELGFRNFDNVKLPISMWWWYFRAVDKLWFPPVIGNRHLHIMVFLMLLELSVFLIRESVWPVFAFLADYSYSSTLAIACISEPRLERASTFSHFWNIYGHNHSHTMLLFRFLSESRLFGWVKLILKSLLFTIA